MRKQLIVIIGIIMMLVLSACSAKENDLTEENLSKLYYDEAENYIEIYVRYNGNTKNNCAEYGIAAESGSEAKNAIFVTKCDEQELYDALLAIGTQPANVSKKDKGTGCRAMGMHMEVYISRKNSNDYTFASLVSTKSNSVFTCDFVFSGDIKTVKKSGTGGILALDSCVNSLISNSDYGYGYISTQKMDEFYSSDMDIKLTDGEIFKVRIFQSSEAL